MSERSDIQGKLITRRTLLCNLLTLPLWAIPLPQLAPDFNLCGWFYQPGWGYYFDTFQVGDSWPDFVARHREQVFYLFVGEEAAMAEFYQETVNLFETGRLFLPVVMK